MRIFLVAILALTLILQSCSGQTQSKKKEVYNKDFNWTITIPENFDTVSVKEWTRLQNKGLDAVEKTYEGKVENIAKTIFVFKNDQLNYFEANYQPFDSTTDGNYLENFRNVNDILYGTFKAQMPDAKLDSASSTEVISGFTFQTFKVTIYFPNKMIMEFWMYSRLFGKREFTVNILTVDKQKQKALFDAWKNSKFGQK